MGWLPTRAFVRRIGRPRRLNAGILALIDPPSVVPL
jgi:hypothetical protein